MQYIYVEDNQVKGSPSEIPKNWKNISNFHAFDAEFWKIHGWYPYRFVKVDVNDNEVLNGSNVVIQENEVVEYQLKRLKTEDEIQNEIKSGWSRIRLQRNELLKRCDWTQLPDSPLNSQKKTEWQIYRQHLRDITDQENPFSISWPINPE